MEGMVKKQMKWSINGIAEQFRVIPVLVIENEAEAKRQLQALSDGGLMAAEITYRTAYAAEAIRYASAQFPEFCIGAGSVTCAQQAEEAAEAGAVFIVSPGLSEEVAAFCREKEVPYLPGCVTPTEIMRAMTLGITTVKFFPAGVYGGLRAIKALAAPFPALRFIPTGGVNTENLAEYLAFPKIAAVGGSWMMQGDTKAECEKIQEMIRTEQNRSGTPQ